MKDERGIGTQELEASERVQVTEKSNINPLGAAETGDNKVHALPPPPRDAWALAFVREMAKQKRLPEAKPKRATVIDFIAAKHRLRK